MRHSVFCAEALSREGDVSRLPVRELSVLRCGVSGDLMERRVDDVGGLNLGRSLDKSCQGLQHFGIRGSVVIFCTDFVVPQTDGSHIDSAGAGERNFILKAVLLAK